MMVWVVVGGGAVIVVVVAVVVVVNGGRAGTRLAVLVNGNPVGYAMAGKATPVPLMPYRNYQISIRPPSDELISLNAGTEQITLLPGMVRRLEWSVDSAKVVIMQVIELTGIKLDGLRLEGALSPAILGEDGWVQIEARANSVLEVQDRKGKTLCTLQMPDLETPGLVLMLGPQICG